MTSTDNMKKYNIITTEILRRIYYQVEAECEEDAKYKVENGIATFSSRKDIDSANCEVESIEEII